MTEQAKVPAIRFAGFTDPWEQRKFSDMYEVNNERNTDCKLGYDRTLSIATMTFNGGNGAADDSLNGYKVIRVGDIAFEGHANKVHAYGRFVLNDAGDGLMSPRFSCLRPIVEQRYSFWKYYIPYEETMRPILVKATKSGTMMNELVPDDLMRESILVPCLAEQEAIGDCLSQLDSLITLHQRKYDKLVVFKKSMLEKMFPKDGESVPEIRFAGFTDPWEQRKLGDYVVVSTAKNADGRFNKEDVLSVSGEYGIVNQIAFQGRSFAGSSVLNYGIVNTGDIVYTKSPLNSNPYGIIKVNKGIPGIVSTLYAVYRPQDNVHTNFIQVYFEQHERMNNYMHPLVNKGAKNDMKVTAENALKGVVTFPSREEQVIISEFFDRLDSLITLHQRKLELLQNIKKSLLDKMFV